MMAVGAPSAGERRVRSVYSSYNHEYYPTETTMYFNLGYWGPGCADLDEACHALVDMLADAAGLGEGDRVLVVGFGFVVLVLRGTDRQERSEMEAGEGLMPAANWCDEETYVTRMREAGFVNVGIRSISDHVYEPLIAYLTGRLTQLREGQAGVEKLVMTEKFIRDMRKAVPTNEYVIAVGENPA